MSNPLIKYLDTLTAKEKADFAHRAGSTAMSVRLAANGYKTKGRLDLTPEFAGRLAAASNGALTRGDLSNTCASCSFFCGEKPICSSN